MRPNSHGQMAITSADNPVEFFAPTVPPEVLKLDNWLPALLAYMKANTLEVATAAEVKELARVEALCQTWAKQFAAFDAEAAQEEAAWQASLAGGPPVTSHRTTGQVWEQRHQMENDQAMTTGNARRACYDMLGREIWPRIRAAGEKLADELDAKEVAFYAAQGFKAVPPRTGAALRQQLTLRSGKPVMACGTQGAPSTMVSDLGISLTEPDEVDDLPEDEAYRQRINARLNKLDKHA